jgi:hypothetical protein
MRVFDALYNTVLVFMMHPRLWLLAGLAITGKSLHILTRFRVILCREMRILIPLLTDLRQNTPQDYVSSSLCLLFISVRAHMYDHPLRL